MVRAIYLLLVAVSVIGINVNGTVAATCYNPTDLNFHDPLVICSSTDSSLCLGVSSGEHPWITLRSLSRNDEDELKDEMLAWHLECQESTGTWILRHAFFYTLCAHQPEPLRFPYRRFLRVGGCEDHTDPDLMLLDFEYDANTQLSVLNLHREEIETNGPFPVCLSTSECFFDYRANCNPFQLPRKLTAGSMLIFNECVDGNPNQEFIVSLAPTAYLDQNSASPTQFPTIPNYTPLPTKAPVESTQTATKSPTQFPTIANNTLMPTKAPVESTQTATKSPSSVQAVNLNATYAEVSHKQQVGEVQVEWTIPAFPGLQVYFRPRILKLYDGASLAVYDCTDLVTPKRLFTYHSNKKFVVSNTGCLHVKLTTNAMATQLSSVRFVYHSRSRNYKLEYLPCTTAKPGKQECTTRSAERVDAGLEPCHYYDETRHRAYGGGQTRIGCEDEQYCHFDNPSYCDARPYCERVGGLCFNSPAPTVSRVADCYKPGRPKEECDTDYCEFYQFNVPNLKTNGNTNHRITYGCRSKYFCNFTKVPHSYAHVPLYAQKVQCGLNDHCHWEANSCIRKY